MFTMCRYVIKLKGGETMIVYDIEKFVIQQMFRPYKTLIVSEENLPEDWLEHKLAYDKRVKDCERELRKNPERIMVILQNNKQAYQYVFERLAGIDFKFYKWLEHPLIPMVYSIVSAFRYAKDKGGE